MEAPQASATPEAEEAATVTVACDATAAFVTLATLAQGRFSDNSFLLPGPGSRTLRFHPIGGVPLDLPLLRASVRVEHLQQRLSEGARGGAGGP